MRTLIAALVLCLPVLAEDAAPKPTDAEAKAKVDAFKEAIKAKADDQKKSAIDALGDCMHPTCVAALQQILLVDTAEMRVAAAAALGKMKGYANAAAALHAGLKPNEKSDSVIAAIFKAMEAVGHPSSVAVCMDWVSDRVSQRDSEDSPSIQQALECLGGLKFKASVDALIDVWHKNKVVGKDPRSKFKERVRNWSDKALQRLTGENFGNQDEWHDWWKKNAGLFNDDLTKK